MEILILFVMVIGLMLIGVPIAVSLGLASILFLLMHSDASLASVAQTLFSAFQGHYTLLAIPFFILASVFMSTGGVAHRIIRFAIAVVGSFRGGIGNGIGFCLHAVCCFIRVFSSYCGSYRYDCDCGYDAGRIHT